MQLLSQQQHLQQRHVQYKVCLEHGTFGVLRIEVGTGWLGHFMCKQSDSIVLSTACTAMVCTLHVRPSMHRKQCSHTLQNAMMSPMIQLAAGLAAAPAASTSSKYWAVGSSSASTSTSAAGKPSSLYFLLYCAGRSGMLACKRLYVFLYLHL